MIPGFVTAYRDINNYIHLYFYPGYDNGDYIYETIKLNNLQIKYIKEEFEDGAIDLLFEDKSIIKFNCILINKISKEPSLITIQA